MILNKLDIEKLEDCYITKFYDNSNDIIYIHCDKILADYLNAFDNVRVFKMITAKTIESFQYIATADYDVSVLK
jgi:hypothetical protein